ncbi:hypothetical protein BCR42DRAFT_368338 [Absidia repens]|uniref:Ras-GEF domain-containing protein n=1 Tax=Absidia repens TaxID=90262 RepID=A0A1X2IUE8_9FUNG|nr:hypothetical protein BCR42DRAFT_368338 [Absidia repens]
MKPRAKKHQHTSSTSPPPSAAASTSSDDQRVTTSALSYLKHRLFHSSKSTTSLTDQHSTVPPASKATTKTSLNSQALDIPDSATLTSSLETDRPCSKSLENDIYLGRPVFRRTTSDLHSPPTIKKDTAAVNRTSQIIWKEGYLYKRTDFRPFHTHKADRGWKLYRVVLRGHKLYLYRTSPQHQDTFNKSIFAVNASSSTTSSLPLVSLTPPPPAPRPPQISNLSPSLSATSTFVPPPMAIVEKNPVTLNLLEFDEQAKQQLSTTLPHHLVHAAVFTEWDLQRKQTATAVNLLIYIDRLVICKKQKQNSGRSPPLWHIQSTTPLSQLVLEPCTFTSSTSASSSSSSSSVVSAPPASQSSSSTSIRPPGSSSSTLRDVTDNKHYLSRQQHANYFPDQTPTLNTFVNQFTLSFVSQPWKQTTYVSLSKDLVSSWMMAFYAAQHASTNEMNTADSRSDQTGEPRTDVPKQRIPTTLEKDSRMDQVATPVDTIIFDEASPHPGLVLNTQDDRQVQGGTIPALVHELLFETQQQGKEYTYAFLLTYTMFTTIAEILDLMKGYLERLDSTPLGISLWNRLLDLYRIWCVRFAYDVVGDLVTGMMERLDALQDNDALPLELRDRGKEIKALVLQTVKDNRHIIEHAQTRRDYSEGTEVVDSIQRYTSENNWSSMKSKEGSAPSTPTTPTATTFASPLASFVVDLSDLVATGLSPALFLSMDPDRLAEQIYVFHHTQHYHHRYQLLSALSYVSRPQLPPQMLNTLLYTSPSPHFLTRLIWQHVLVETQIQHTDNAMVMRTNLLEHWIRVGAVLMELKDMTGWCAVAMGVCSMEIARLKEAWKTVDRSLVKLVTRVWSPLLADHGLYSLDVWMEGWEHDHRLQHTFSQVLDVDTLDLLEKSNLDDSISNLRSLPHFGSIKQSVDRLRRHVPLHLSCEKSKRVPSSTMAVVNFTSSWCVHDIIRAGLGKWKKGRHLTWEENDIKGILPFPVVRPLQMYFDTAVNQVSSVPHDFKYLHECSVACEPRIFGQALVDRSSSEVASPSYSPLAFPDTLTSSYSFFPKFASLKLFGQATEKQDIQRLPPNGHGVQLVHRQEQYSSLTEASLCALKKVSVTTTQDTKRHSVVTLFDEDLSEWMDDTSFGSQRELVKKLGQQLELTRQQRRPNEQSNSIWLFHVHENSLVVSAEALLPLPKSFTSTTLLGLESTNREMWNAATALLNVRAGHIEPLVDALVHGVGQYKTVLQQHWRALGPSSTSQSEKLDLTIPMMNDDGYMCVFFTTYRMFCSPKRLMMILQDQFIQAKTHGLQAKRRQQEQTKKQRRRMTMMDAGIVSTGLAKLDNMEGEAATVSGETDVSAYDWLVVAKTQLRVVHLLMYWIESHFYDVVDEIDLLSGMLDLMMTAKNSLALWQLPLAQYHDQVISANQGDDSGDNDSGVGQPIHVDTGVEQNIKAALAMGDKIGARLEQLQTLLARKSLSPRYDLKALQYDTQGSRNADELYRQLTNGQQQFSVQLQLATSKTSTFSLVRAPLDDTAASVVDRYPASTLLEQADRAVRQLFGSVTLQDWIQTTDVLEAQSNDLYAWLPARNKKDPVGTQTTSASTSTSTSTSTSSTSTSTSTSSSSSASILQNQQQQQRPSLMSSALSPVIDVPSAHYSDYHHLHTDEIIISDIFTGIEGARRSMVSPMAFSVDDLLLAFPSSIQYLYCMHYIIRSWVIHQVTASKIDLSNRVARIDTFLHMIQLSRQSCQRMDLFAELKEAAATPAAPKEDENPTTYIPGFVENAIASALVSPEVRLFTKAWKWIGQKYQVSDLDTLASILKNIACDTSLPTTPASQSDSRLGDGLLLAPSIGWIFERIIELSLVVPDTYQGMIHFDKRRYIYGFVQMLVNAQLQLETQPAPQTIGMSFLISPNNKKRTWKTLKDEAHKEKMQNHHHHHRHLHQRNVSSSSSKLKSSHSPSSIGSSSSASSWHLSTKHGVFSKLVMAQMEKLKRDIKERERIDREWKDVQHKWQKRQVDHRQRGKDDIRSGTRHRRHASSSSINVTSSPSLSGQQTVIPSSPSFNGSSPHGIKWPSLLRTLRPPSMASFHMLDDHQHHHHHQHGDSARLRKQTTALTSDDDSGMIKAAMVINLIHATTSIASGYEKRPFVFRVVTEEGAQYLLQGANVEDMQNWMDEINQAARYGTAKRRSVFAAESKQEVDTSIPTVEARKGKSKTITAPAAPRTRTTVYGMTLESLTEREHNDIPQLVTTCVLEIERRGLEEVGIYRVAGTGSVVQQLKKAFNSDSTSVNVDQDHYPDINVVADALKQFLRELPEPLMTFTLYEEFINASASEDHDDRVYSIKQVIQKLPTANYHLLKRLIEHFVVVTDYESVNHMYATNLAIVFGPTLLQPTPGPAAFTTSMSNLGHHQNIVKYLILHYHYLFGIEGAE